MVNLDETPKMLVHCAFKTELNPTKEQAPLFNKHADVRRFAYNYGVSRKHETADQNDAIEVINAVNESQGNPLIKPLRYPTAVDLAKELVNSKNTDRPWLGEVSKHVRQEALRDLDSAVHNHFKNPEHFGFPQFKSKQDTRPSFTFTGNSPTAQKVIELEAWRIKLPFIGWVRLKEHVKLLERFRKVIIHSATVSKVAGRWFVSLGIEVEREAPVPQTGEPFGADRGYGDELLVISNADRTKFEVIKNPRLYRKAEKKLAHLQRIASRKQQGSKRRVKAQLKVARLNYHIAEVRKDFIHKTTTRLAKTYPALVVETLSVKPMAKENGKSVADAAMSEIVRQLEYKTWYGMELIHADRWYPSTQRCSRCHGRYKIDRDELVYRCPSCSLVAGRNVNAAANLAQWPTVRGTLKTTATESEELGGQSGKGAW